MPLTIEPFAADSPLLEGASRVFTETWEWSRAQAAAFIARYVRYPDFRGFVARSNVEVIGMGFGTRSLPGQWWHDTVAAHAGPDNPALLDAWVLVALAVLLPYRGQGIGGLLHDTLLENQPCPRALLSTEAENAIARQLYEQRGWHYLHSGSVFAEGEPRFVVMHREMRRER